MKIPPTLLGILVVATLQAPMFSQTLGAAGNGSDLKVVLLGTAGGPTFSAQRLGIATLVQAGPEILLFDCGRGLTTGMARMSINTADVTKVFLTHLHSDHVVALPELYLEPWAVAGRFMCEVRKGHGR